MSSAPSLRTRILLIALLAFMLLTAALGAWQRSQPASADAPADDGGTQLVMGPGDEVAFPGDARVRFVEVVADSRCPADAMCPTMGEAVVAFAVVTVDGRHERIEIVFNGEPARASVDGLVIIVTDVQPYPLASQPAAPGDYRVAVDFDQE